MSSNHKVIKWGKTKDDKQRWYCKSCQRCFVWKKKKTHHRKWFKMWLDGMTIKQISEVVRKSTKTIGRETNYFLERSPKANIILNKKSNLLIDGTYFKRENCFVIYYDHKLKHHQLWRYAKSEKEHEIKTDLRELKRNGVSLFSVTSDGHSSIKSALNKVYPDCIHQRCLVHIQRLSFEVFFF